MRDAYAGVAREYKDKFGEPLTELAAMGVSAMMHGYMAFDKDENLLVPFRTWRNTCTERASKELSELFNFHIPQRWTVAHFYEAILKNEPHVPRVEYIYTLECYVHYMLTGERVTGIGEASGIIPVRGKEYDPEMMRKFNELIKEKGVDKDFEQLIPRPLVAGECGGYLTEKGARWLDPTGELKPVEGTAFDFRTPKTIGRDINTDCDEINFAGGYDHCFNFVGGETEEPVKRAELYDKVSGRVMSVYTNQPCVQFYTGNFLKNEKYPFKGGYAQCPQTFLCLETQHMPDSINHDNFTDCVLRPDKKYDYTTEYRFSVK